MKGLAVVYTILGVLIIAVSVLFGLQFSQPDQEVVYVNSDKLMSEFVLMKAARSEFEQKKKTWQANVDTLASEFQKAMQKHEKELSSMSAKEKQLSEELLRNKQQEYMRYQQAMNQKAQEEDGRMTQQVLTEVNAFIKEYGKKHNYHLILGATNMGNIVYAEDGIDITDDLIQAINSKYASGTN